MTHLRAAFGLALVLSAALPGAADAASIERVFGVGNEPFGVTIDPADGRIYVANSDGLATDRPGVLSVVDPASPACTPLSCTSVKTIALASPPVMSALDRGLGRLFVTTAKNSTLTFVDIATQSVVNSIPNAGGVGVAVDESNHHVYAASSTSLSMVDGVTGNVLLKATAGPNDTWWAVALDTGAHRVYVTNLDTSSPSLVILDSDNLSLIGEVPLPELPRLALAVDTARQLVYVGGYYSAGYLYVIDANSRQITRTLDLQAGRSFPFSATLVTSEDRLYLSQISLDFGPNSIVVLDLATLEVVQRISLPWQPGATALHANGRLYVAAISADLLAGVLVADTAPTASVALDVTSPTTNQVITANATASDADGDTLTYTFTWKVNAVVRATTSGPNASSSFDLSITGNGDKGQTVSVELVASDGALPSATALATATVVNSAPTVTVSLNDVTPPSNDEVTAIASARDADADAVTLTYAWAVNGVTKQVSSSSRFDLGVKGNGDNGDVITVLVTASDGAASATASASAIVTPGHRN